ncbi:2-aminoethylphosphonate aminotransferase [Burkholderia thailandensis]|uniref:2-aminoethylphosphonate--pyruvate transaminase n=1 Tax=Burkholderia thailandensis TaxID=57975 RepID=A0AAW9CUW4_BURTH|nr:2-aminoethylphosphonate aminotransferase [Burkholderia thailandensis]AHI67509.1 2-aminoethylphosphonate aminotransferase family protein [Burkholderia thailandensis H0587]AIP66102.1 2-aminoethylphosphonate aminotransferase [Burkholderia thailandensis]AJY32800.1 2-aminoethylphosphonate aminotransferase family protein [Burkholderia thailandensis 34]AOI55386.1 2-aminoethylphosphonate aminotransferase [Burkholderia thailandensis]AOJ54414.1 2-aminoethylphosphonate aminotransferase [Burkholderia t
MLLLNPGPVTLTERVRQSLLQPDLCHRESEFFDLQDEARARLVAAYALDPAEWSAVLMTGSGTAAVESMIAALVPESGKLLVIENGVYGERITQIATQYRIAHDVLKHDWMQAPDLARIAEKLDADRAITHVAVIHHETTTGRLNDLDALAAVCRARGVRMLVDGVSSFGAEAIDFAGGGIDALAATANKCLHGVPGAAFVIVRRRALASAASRTYYLDLGRLAKLQDARNTPFTPSVHAYYALVEALREFDEAGGWRARHARYAALAEQVRAGLAARGMPPVLPESESSVVLRAYRLPAGVTYEQLHDGLKARGFVIYAGQGGLSSALFRISTMGAIAAADVDRLLDGFAALTR